MLKKHPDISTSFKPNKINKRYRVVFFVYASSGDGGWSLSFLWTLRCRLRLETTEK